MSLAEWFRENYLPGAGRPLELNEIDLSPRPKPRLAAVNRAPSREEFARWRDDDVTQFVFAALKRNSEECREQWVQSSWEGGLCDPEQLIALRERSDALEGFTASYEAFCETLDLEPEPTEGAKE